ncbi:MAG TPA: NADH-quinone oxidoreductase subunit NuoH [Phenylobacterium sp.]|jgi:NADH-quinone oxidoreductase subunit H|uniref:NADH-quinone oxidoreductase subunit NuoH n=1 Tax=Phenylobacterium sp. TaxID=1871053 RepID=UPI002D0E0141|nr:NADH-quinone oxidoreductase subunit NuoH [Phenylobacterium sp.]HXA38344.1 NADH-quinone oxidoreductase subunit NuoH [Phenylobacterium sp.]
MAVSTTVTTAAIQSDSPVIWTLLTVGQILLVTVVLLLTVAFLIYGDRKIFAGVQMRKGPNVVGPFGLLQSFADLGKFLIKELIVPAGADKFVFLLAPLISVTLALGSWAAIPLAPGWVISNINVGILYLFAVSSMGVYGIIMGGWASNSKYPFLGALRSAAQMVSYEVSIGFVIITVILLSGTMNLTRITEMQAGGFWHWNILGGAGLKNLPLALVMIPMGVIFFISGLAETNRPPFDLPEAESELVAGYAIEYGSTPYMLFYLAETSNIILMSGLMAVLFLGGWQAPFPVPASFSAHFPATVISLVGLFWLAAKTFFVFFMNAMVRSVVPRYRYDQLMRLGWKVFLPTSLVAVALVAGWRVYGGIG